MISVASLEVMPKEAVSREAVTREAKPQKLMEQEITEQEVSAKAVMAELVSGGADIVCLDVDDASDAGPAPAGSDSAQASDPVPASAQAGNPALAQPRPATDLAFWHQWKRELSAQSVSGGVLGRVCLAAKVGSLVEYNVATQAEVDFVWCPEWLLPKDMTRDDAPEVAVSYQPWLREFKLMPSATSAHTALSNSATPVGVAFSANICFPREDPATSRISQLDMSTISVTLATWAMFHGATILVTDHLPEAFQARQVCFRDLSGMDLSNSTSTTTTHKEMIQ